LGGNGCALGRIIRAAMFKRENDTIEQETLELENSHLVNCVVRNCDVFYSGGSFEWQNVTWENVRWHFRGPALNTIQLLQTIGLLKAGQKPPPQVTGSTTVNLD
jgi:hypothetical protein